ncbi:MAG: hypothetical protein K6A94_04840 [Bacteroidales bacterium]|nr:hypothetical protein [Bacteroidales bacterium]
MINDNLEPNVTFDDDDWSLDINPDEEYWERLIEEIINGNVVPVIGAEMLVEHCPNIHQTNIDQLAKKLKISGNISSFSELVYHRDYRQKPDNIYHYVDAYLNQKKLSPSNLLKRLSYTEKS